MFALYNPETRCAATFEIDEDSVVVRISTKTKHLTAKTAREEWRRLRAEGFVRVDEKPYVKATRTGFSTKYSAAGTIEALEAWRERLYTNYHPCGYGTYVRWGDTLQGTQVFMASGSRQNSCD